ncbi:MAG: hypothetical protein B7X65_23405 [Polaromonas sp. 39-63-25]|nr:MAG: hypothetical protein B7Y28_23615 [Polaromonas sp. 16-63-31]OYZ75342.1 MAG: hypothetical protein B7Y09_24520 [Polaromonas sp. 24-63-21]OZA45327.1 MAG: hypothetical protein B7X88_24760 [Polaromonas sp. 17-63-33]OZA84983.1 MAG: hypothetical protein B7X65_23405 [Polaromonas sp. 39-63-25]
MKRVNYTPEFKAEAVKQVIERGHGLVEVANRLGVSEVEVDPIPRTGNGLILKPMIAQVQGCPRRRSAHATNRPTRWATRVRKRDLRARFVSFQSGWATGSSVPSVCGAGCTSPRSR